MQLSCNWDVLQLPRIKAFSKLKSRKRIYFYEQINNSMIREIPNLLELIIVVLIDKDKMFFRHDDWQNPSLACRGCLNFSSIRFDVLREKCWRKCEMSWAPDVVSTFLSFSFIAFRA